MLKSIKKEIKMRNSYLNDDKVSSIYFGGGTPSVLNKEEITSLINTIYDNFKIDTDAEITLECNPDDLDKKKLIELKEVGISRLSIGIQSFDDKYLKLMNRSHNAKEAFSCIQTAKEVGFENISIDLIYGLPNQSNRNWEENLAKMLNLDIQHFSAYSLTVENKTKLKYQIDNKIIKPLDDKITVKHFNTLIEKASKNNFVHYEISNFAKEGFFSKHNTAYWENRHYLGVGPSAHSFNGNSRQWNIASNKKYIEKVNSDDSYFESEKLSNTQKYNEYIFTALRTIWGVELEYINHQFGKKKLNYFKKQVINWENKGNVHVQNGKYTLTKSGKLYADAIASDLFIV
tara:strand:- start:415 stop:1449 length:1035 start_codon:yes stop_codon:yes gene_type:complete